MQSGLSLFGDCKERPGSVLVWIGSLSRGSMKWALEDWVRVLAGSLRCRGSFPAVAVSDPGRGPEYCRCTWMGGARGHPSVPSLSQGGSRWVAQQAVTPQLAAAPPRGRQLSFLVGLSLWHWSFLCTPADRHLLSCLEASQPPLYPTSQVGRRAQAFVSPSQLTGGQALSCPPVFLQASISPCPSSFHLLRKAASSSSAACLRALKLLQNLVKEGGVTIPGLVSFQSGKRGKC